MFELLISFLQIGAFSIGGGYATLPLIQEQIVELHQWLTYKEFTDIITISQMTPGPLAVNGSIADWRNTGSDCRHFRLRHQRHPHLAVASPLFSKKPQSMH